MLKPENRLKKLRDFNLLIKQGQWIGGDVLSLKILDLSKIPPELFPKPIKTGKENLENFKKQLRLAFNVSLKISKSAVKRNRLKRQMREVTRLLIKDDKIKDGFYGMFNANKGSLDLNYAEISEKMELLLKKAKLL